MLWTLTVCALLCLDKAFFQPIHNKYWRLTKAHLFSQMVSGTVLQVSCSFPVWTLKSPSKIMEKVKLFLKCTHLDNSQTASRSHIQATFSSTGRTFLPHIHRVYGGIWFLYEKRVQLPVYPVCAANIPNTCIFPSPALYPKGIALDTHLLPWGWWMRLQRPAVERLAAQEPSGGHRQWGKL